MEMASLGVRVVLQVPHLSKIIRHLRQIGLFYKSLPRWLRRFYMREPKLKHRLAIL